MEKGDFKKQVIAWRWLGEDSCASWGLVAQLMVALQKIDMLEEKCAYTLDENERKEKRLKKEKFFFLNEALKKVIGIQTIEITDNRWIMKNLKEENKKLKSDEKLASQPEPVVLRQTKLDLEAVKKALTDLKETKQYVSNLAEARGKYIDTMHFGERCFTGL